MAGNHGIERILKEMLDDATRPRTEAQNKAGAAANYGYGSVKDVEDANRRARKRRSRG